MGKGSGYFTNYPKHVFLILTSEFCERFSYYGLKAILVIYLTRALGFSDNTATAIYHSFNVVCYFTPLLGAMLADGWLGKFWTILSVSFLYAIGNIILTVTSIPFGGSYLQWGVFVGLAIIAIGTGGIKPCVSAFGGDQFSPDQTRQKESFFSLFYMSINIGSLISTIITPLIRSNVFCFNDNCYALAFGIPAVLMISSIGVYALGSPWYTKVPAAGDNVLGRIIGCVGTALKGKCSPKTEKKQHWLDHAVSDEYDEQFVEDMKDVMRVLWLFLPLPFFWAVYDQQGSRWTLQATQMNGDFGSITVEPDMLGFANPLLVVIFVPLIESIVYPVLDKLRIPNRPLQRMVWGMIFAASAFLLAAFVQLSIDGAVPKPAGDGQSKIMFINTASCKVDVNNSDTMLHVTARSSSDYYYIPADQHVYQLTDCRGRASKVDYLLNQTKSYHMVIISSTGNKTLLFEQEKVAPTPNSASTVRIFNALNTAVNVTLKPTKDQEDPHVLADIASNAMSEYVTLVYADFEVILASSSAALPVTAKQQIVSRNGAIYVILLTYNNVSSTSLDDVVVSQITDLGPRTVNIFLQIPQYVIITIGEVLFSITGLAFAYSQSPVSMKSLLTAAWLLTICFGNVIVIIIAETAGSTMTQVNEFFLFAGLLYGFTVVFIIMSMFYKYVEPRTDDSPTDKPADAQNGSVSAQDEKNKPVMTTSYINHDQDKLALYENYMSKADKPADAQNGSVSAHHDQDKLALYENYMPKEAEANYVTKF